MFILPFAFTLLCERENTAKRVVLLLLVLIPLSIISSPKISAVSSDEEAADLIVYQKAYEAASRLMTAMDDLLDTIINRMGRVGL